MFRRALHRVFFLFLLLVFPAPFVVAQQSPQIPVSQVDIGHSADPDAPQVEAIQREIEAKERAVKALDARIDQYRQRIQQQAAAAETLQAQLALLDARAEEQALRLERSAQESERLRLQQRRLETDIQAKEALLAVRRRLLEEALANLGAAWDDAPLKALLQARSLSAYFARREEWRSLQIALAQLTADVRTAKEALEQERAVLETTAQAQSAERKALEAAAAQLDEERAAKQSLVSATRNREDQFRRIVADLQREQQEENASVDALRDRLQGGLAEADEALARGDVLLQWPLQAKKGISAHFHDETYPFRQLFEHPGIDLPAPVGTPVRAAAGGYVAWNRRGRQYGNYVMVIHPNGIATVYAHLSGFVAKPDTYVERGEIIGFSGGKPGDDGAGLSTGPHLHFEVRQNGLPVDPLLFLPEA